MVKIGKEEIRMQCATCGEDMAYISNLNIDGRDVIAMGCPSKDCWHLIYVSLEDYR